MSANGKKPIFHDPKLALADWQKAQPANLFTSDRNFRHALEFYWGEQMLRRHAPKLYQFGGVAKQLDALVATANLPQNQPTLERFNGLGGRIEDVRFHPAHHDAGKLIYGSGVMTALEKPGNNLLSLALFYLSAQQGEAGHNCPLACTAGAIKTLQQKGSPALKKRYLPKMLDPDYDSNYHAAQFFTEIQGGSDVGANQTKATPLDKKEGSWLINGEKWFCSNVTADVILATARVEGQGEGTAGLGLFLIPRRLPNGALNRFAINRLKDKLGTRSLATGEVAFQDTLAYQIGDTKEGFKIAIEQIINCSRLYNGVAAAGIARRAFTIASSYVQYRRAFGREIVHFPIVQEMLARMRADAAGILAGSFVIAQALDKAESGKMSDDQADFARIAINLNKLRSAMLSHQVANQAIELLGGNGAIESFSPLPRLLRDNVVYENWEGSHNVLLAQMGRDMRRYQAHLPVLDKLRQLVEPVSSPPEFKEGLIAGIDGIEAEIEHVLTMDELTAGIYLRPLMIRLADLYYATCLAAEGEWELTNKEDRSKQRLAVLFFSRRAQGKEPKDIPYYDDLVSRLAVEG